MDIKKVKEKHGDKICLIGNVDCGHTLVSGSKEEVIKETRYCLKWAAPKGGYMLSSSNSIHDAVDIENFKTMIATGKKYGKYPLRG